MVSNRKIPYISVKNALITAGFVIDSHLCLIEDWPYMIEYTFATHQWDGGYHSGHGYNGSLPEFENNANVMFAVLENVLNELGESQGIWAPSFLDCYFEHWSDLNRFPYYHQVKRFLHNNHVRIDSRDGILIKYPDDTDIIKLFIKCGFVYLSRGMLFFPQSSLIIKAYHHMNIRLYTRYPNRELAEVLCNTPHADKIKIYTKF